MSAPRYAVYFAPEPDTALAEFGRRWFDETAPHCCADAIRDASRYGFHATLKAPFRLAEGRTAEQLEAAMADFASRREPLLAPPLQLSALGDFLALRPAGPCRPLDALAESVLRHFDHFRAAASAEELGRRAVGLDERQRALLGTWGYPYVLDQYRFHMTLTDRLADGERARVRAVLEPLVEAVEREPLSIRSLCLFVQPSPDDAFYLHQRFSGRP